MTNCFDTIWNGDYNLNLLIESELQGLGSKPYVYEFLKSKIATLTTYLEDLNTRDSSKKNKVKKMLTDLEEEWKRRRGPNSIVNFSR